jgi:hypothetical protein
MTYRFIIIDNKVNSIIEHQGGSVLASVQTVYTGTIDWAIKSLPLLGIDISRIFSDGLAVKPAESPLKVVPISDGREFHVSSLPINSESKFFVIRGFVRDGSTDKQVDLLADDETVLTLEDGTKIGEFSYYKQLISEGYPLLDLVTQGILQRDADGTIDRKLSLS